MKDLASMHDNTAENRTAPPIDLKETPEDQEGMDIRSRSLKNELELLKKLNFLLEEKNRKLDEQCVSLANEKEALLKSLRTVTSHISQGHEPASLIAHLSRGLDESRQKEALLASQLAGARNAAKALEAENRRLAEELENTGKKEQESLGALKSLEAEYEVLQHALMAAKRALAARDASFGNRVRLLLKNRKGLSRFLHFPVALARACGFSQPLPEGWLDEIRRLCGQKDFLAAERYAREFAHEPKDLAASLTEIAKAARGTDPALALRFIQRAATYEPSAARTKLQAFLQFHMGNVGAAWALLAQIEDKSGFTSWQKTGWTRISALRNYLGKTVALPAPPAKPPYDPDDLSVLLVMPPSRAVADIDASGRTVPLLKALREAGFRISLATRGKSSYSGFARIFELKRNLSGAKSSLAAQANEIASCGREAQAACIYGISPWSLALPALMAARSLGIPFVYDIRGLGQYNYPENVPDYVKSQLFRIGDKLETLTAREADAVLAWQPAVADRLRKKGVPAERVHLLPQCARPGTCAWPPAPDHKQFRVLHFGLPENSILEELTAAFAMLRKKAPDATLEIVAQTSGQDASLPGFITILPPDAFPQNAAYSGRYSAVIFTSPPSIRARLVACPNFLDISGVPLVVADALLPAPPLANGENCLTWLAGNARSLADALHLLARDPGLRKNIAMMASACPAPDWFGIGARMIDIFNSLGVARELENSGYASMLAHWQTSAAREQNWIIPTPEKRRRLNIPLSARGKRLGEAEKVLVRERLRAAAPEGMAKTREFIAAQCVARPLSALDYCIEQAGQSFLALGRQEEVYALVRDFLADYKSAQAMRTGAKIYYANADIGKALSLARCLGRSKESLTASEEKFSAKIENTARLMRMARQPAAQRQIPGTERRVLNLLAFSLPESSVGYATRSHGLAQGLLRAGWEVVACTRPGFPWDSKAETLAMDFPDTETVDNVAYHRLRDFHRKELNDVDYLIKSIEVYERLIRQHRPAVVHAASNYAVALPALIASRRLGVPFVYEIRGFWEITRASRKPDFVHSQKYRFMRLFEDLAAFNADHVITITTPMKNDLIRRGIPEGKISIAYNSVEAERFLPAPRNQELAARLGIPPDAPVIGYVGSLVDYEGLDDLIRACAALNNSGSVFRLLVVGDGLALESLKALAESSGLGDKAIFTGRVPFEEVDSYYSLIDIAPFPRKPWPVCELVSPLKPLEAMSMQKAVIMSATEALREMATPETAVLFKAGDSGDLLEKLRLLLADAALRQNLGKAARQWVKQERSWTVAARVCVDAYREMEKCPAK